MKYYWEWFPAIFVPMFLGLSSILIVGIAVGFNEMFQFLFNHVGYVVYGIGLYLLWMGYEIISSWNRFNQYEKQGLIFTTKKIK